MIALVTGKIGSGKTLHCVGLIVRHLAKGGTVCTNIDLDHGKVAEFIARKHRVRITPDQLRPVDVAKDPRWHESIPWGTPELPVLCIWDEIHLFFNSRNWAKTQALHSDMLSFLSQSRKACVDVYFICQVASTLEKQFRVQSQFEFFCRALREIKVPFVGMIPLNLMLLVQKDISDDPGKTVVHRSQFCRYRKELFPLYDTRSFLDEQMRQASLSAVRVAPVKLQKLHWWQFLFERAFWRQVALSGLGLFVAFVWLLYRL